MEPKHLDRMLDDGLARYGDAEPSAGLEARVLVGIRRERASRREWKWWPALAAVIAILLVAAIFTRRTSEITNGPIATRGEVAGKAASERSRAVGRSSVPAQASPPHKAKIFRQFQPGRINIAGAPRLEQFPSPRPLSEQEEILLNYVRKFTEKAVLIARDQTEFQKKEALAEQQPAQRTGISESSSDENP